MQGLIHYNPALQHQIDHANAFKACGFAATADPYRPAEIHVVSGPHYALDRWREHPNCLVIDRAWWGDPDCVSIGWLNSDGTRNFAQGSAPRPKPEYEPWKTREASCLILADYGQDISELSYEASMRFVSIQSRLHPADSTQRHQITLDTMLRLHDVAIGNSGTAIFDAIMQGVPAICTDPLNECMPVCAPTMDSELFRGDRTEWLHDMSYKQFTLAEIADGTAWNLLKDIQ